jgi:UDP-N-acetylmuramoyl-L-alanyl-D-glutamate--2,6-diaminopimelate ligase
VFSACWATSPACAAACSWPGRNNGAPVYVDYAHTPDALETALKALRPHVLGRLHRRLRRGRGPGPGKRPLMGQAAAAQADVVIVTDDNPRSEDPAEIRAAVLQGCPRRPRSATGPRRSCAPSTRWRPGDALLIAGKGHETGQQVGDVVYPFDDVEQASVAVAALEGRA